MKFRIHLKILPLTYPSIHPSTHSIFCTCLSNIMSHMGLLEPLLTYKALTGVSPSHFQGLIVPYIAKRTLKSQRASSLVVSRMFKSSLGRRAFSYQAALLWNLLTTWVREADNTVRVRGDTQEQHGGWLKHSFIPGRGTTNQAVSASGTKGGQIPATSESNSLRQSQSPVVQAGSKYRNPKQNKTIQSNTKTSAGMSYEHTFWQSFQISAINLTLITDEKQVLWSGMPRRWRREIEGESRHQPVAVTTKFAFKIQVKTFLFSKAHSWS